MVFRARNAWILALILLLGWLGWGNPPVPVGTSAALRSSSSLTADRVYIVVAPGLTWDDVFCLQEIRGWDRLLNQGALGNLNTQTAGTANRLEAYLTLSAGSRARWPQADVTAYGAGEIPVEEVSAVTLYGQLTGENPEGLVLFPLWQLVRLEQNRVLHGVEPGLLADELGKLGLETAVVANADLPGQVDRSAAAIAAGSGGVVPLGRVDPGLLTLNPDFPGGQQLDWQAVEHEIASLPLSAAAVVIEASDLVRLLKWQDRMPSPHWQSLWDESLAQMGTFLDRLMDRNEESIIMLLSPVARTSALASRQTLTPVVVWGAGEGQLISSTTRQPGLVANIDVASSVLAALGGSELTTGYGRPFRILAGTPDLPAVSVMATALPANDLRRAPLVQTYVGLAVLATVAIVVSTLGLKKIMPIAIHLSLWTMSVPVAMVWMGLAPGLGVEMSLLAVAVITALLWLLSRRFARGAVVLAWVTWATIVVDVWVGSSLARGAPLGFSLVAGARYYGIGNEMAGLLAGATLFLAAVTRPVLAVAALVVSIVSIAAPNLGANFGVSIALIVGSVLVVRKRRAVSALPQAVILALGLGLVIFGLDRLRDPHLQSHLGVLGSRSQLVTELGQTMLRKLSMSVKLFRWTVWTRAWIGLTALLGVLLVIRPSGLNRLLGRVKGLDHVLWGALAASFTALVVNDSGVVVGATLLIFPVLGSAQILLSLESTKSD